MLYDFLILNRDELIKRTREKVVRRMAPRATNEELEHGVPLFLSQLTEILRLAQCPPPEQDSSIGRSAARHGGELRRQGFTIGQVVHDYGDVCQAVTELAIETGESISSDDFHTFNRCLDDAMSQAVTAFQSEREDVAATLEGERLGNFAHELRKSCRLP